MHPDVLAHIHEHARPVKEVILEFLEWLEALKLKYIIQWVYMPTSFDHWQFFRGLIYDHQPPGTKSELRVPHDPSCLFTMLWIASTFHNISEADIDECPDYSCTHYAGNEAARQGWLYLRVMELIQLRVDERTTTSPSKRHGTEGDAPEGHRDTQVESSSRAVASTSNNSIPGPSASYMPLPTNLERVVVSLDVETDGPTISSNSCLMIGLAVVKSSYAPPLPPPSCNKPSRSKRNTSQDPSWIIERKFWCLEPQAGKHVDEHTTTEFWNRKPGPAVLSYIRRHAQSAEEVIPEFLQWLEVLQSKYIIEQWICMPASFDWQFLCGLLYDHAPDNLARIPRRAICFSTMRWMAKSFDDITAEKTGYCPDFNYTHFADEDAARQGWIYLRIKGLLLGSRQDQRTADFH